MSATACPLRAPGFIYSSFTGSVLFIFFLFFVVLFVCFISSITRIVPQQTAHTYRKVNEICLIQLQKQLTFPVHLNINDLLKCSIIFLEIFNLGMLMSYLRYLCLFPHRGVKHILTMAGDF
jgi:hypothetical protein